MNRALHSTQDNALVIEAPYSTLHIKEINFVDHVSMRSAALSEILRLMAADEPSNVMMNLCARLALDLRSAYSDAKAALIFAQQLGEILLSEQSDDGPGDMLWLCQQIGDELESILGVMIATAREGVAA